MEEIPEREIFLKLYPGIEYKKCRICGKSGVIAEILGICIDCLYERNEEALNIIRDIHGRIRQEYGLPEEVPQEGHKECPLCVNRCKPKPEEKGLCGVRKGAENGVTPIYGTRAPLEWYHDPLPTNCVAEWVCAARGVGWPKYSCSRSTERGYTNLAVFYRGCSFNCIFCQNWHFRLKEGEFLTPSELASKVDRRTACICYFGGDPAPLSWHSIATSLIARDREKVRILRFCWETNGSINPRIMRRISEIALKSGGTVKIDLKAFTPSLHYALTGASNEWTLENIEFLASLIPRRGKPPILVVSTLLVPGYVGPREVDKISKFLYKLNPDIPYSLLAFYPHFYAHDLPRTSRAHAMACREVALKNGLRNVHIGNVGLLW